MKYANKLMVVPYTKALEDPEQAKLVELDTNMSTILADKNTNLDEKIKLYNQTLARYMSKFKSDTFAKPKVLNELTEKIENVVDKNNKIQDDIEFIKELVRNNTNQEITVKKEENKVNKSKKNRVKKETTKISPNKLTKLLSNLTQLDNSNITKHGRNSRYVDPVENGVLTRGMEKNMAIIEPESILDASTNPLNPPNITINNPGKLLKVPQSTDLFTNRLKPNVPAALIKQTSPSNNHSQSMNLQMDTTMDITNDQSLNASQYFETNDSIVRANNSYYPIERNISQTPIKPTWLNDKISKK
jgi:hypothetical protein